MRFFTCPQPEQRLVDGNQREAMKPCPPADAILFFKKVSNCPIAASATARASFRFAIIPRMWRSSMPIAPHVRTSSVVNLCCPSLQGTEALSMDRERLLVLKSSPIGDHGSLLQAHIYPH